MFLQCFVSDQTNCTFRDYLLTCYVNYLLCFKRYSTVFLLTFYYLFNHFAACWLVERVSSSAAGQWQRMLVCAVGPLRCIKRNRNADAGRIWIDAENQGTTCTTKSTTVHVLLLRRWTPGLQRTQSLRGERPSRVSSGLRISGRFLQLKDALKPLCVGAVMQGSALS